MADIQKQFEEFHTEILLSDSDGKAKLQEKRDLLISDLRAGLKREAEKKNETPLKFEHFNQGSYAMHTGTKPYDNDYDIDVGIIFDNTRDDFDSPVELKKKVKDALNSTFRTVKIRRPCVTVTYQKDGKPDYHVDLAIYVKVDGEDYFQIAMGKENSSEDNQEWQDSDPKGLINKINNQFTGDDRTQYRCSIRYLKRWRDKQFRNSGAPISIALTCAAYHWFQPVKSAGKYNDLKALIALVDEMLDNFDIFGRLEIELPVIPHSDLLDRMTDTQMDTFKEKLELFQDTLIRARNETSKKEACKKLKKLFGDEFPVPEGDDKPKDKVRRSSKSPVVTTGTSA